MVEVPFAEAKVVELDWFSVRNTPFMRAKAKGVQTWPMGSIYCRFQVALAVARV